MSAKRVTTIAIVIAAILVAAVTLSLTWPRITGSLGGSASGNTVEAVATGPSSAGAAAASASGSSDGLGQPAHPDWPTPSDTPRPDIDVLAYPYLFMGPGR